MEQYYKVAGLTLRMDSFGRTVEQAAPYRIETPCEQPDMVIHGDWKALQADQPHLSDEDCEYLVTGGSFYRQLITFGGLLLHASAVVMDGGAYLFSAPCGTGKSTHTALWRRVFGERAKILNDDKPALRLEDGIWYAYGTPWSGKTDQSLNIRVPLTGICFLSQGKENKIVPYGGAKALHAALEQTVRPRDPELLGNLLDLLDKLLTTVPVWRMECNMAPEAAVLSHQVMSLGIKK